MSSPKALIFSTIQGHASIAEAITEGLTQKGWQTKTYSFTDPALVFYRWVYRHAPWLCRYYYKLLFFPISLKLVSWYTHKTHRAVFEQAIKEYPTDLIIGTTYGFDSSVFKYQQKQKKNGNTPASYINIVVDPRTFFSTNLNINADVNCVFDQETVEYATRLKTNAVVAETGWFVRKRFRKTVSKQQERQALGLDPKLLTILVVAGSEGETKSAKLIKPMLADKQPLQIILACGSNQKLKQEFDQLAATLSAEAEKKLIVLPFTKNIHQYMQAADLIIGKAGPNMVFEAVATETPFFATTHIAGQEDGNLELIRQYNIGYVEEDLAKAEKVLAQILKNPDQLKSFAPSLKALASYNDQSVTKLVKIIQQLKEKKL